MIFLSLFLFAADTIDIDVDPVAYRSTIIMEDTTAQTSTHTDILYLEFNCGIPYHELSYEMTDTILATRALITFKLSNLNKPDSLLDTLRRQFTIASFKQAAQEQIAFIVQFGLHIPDGDYVYTIGVTSGDKQGTISDTIALRMDDYAMSDLLLARQITLDTIGDYLRKGNLQVVPQASHTFNDRFSHLFVYYEIYDIVPDTGTMEISYEIVADDGTILSTTSQIISKKFSSQAMNAGMRIKNLDAGEYTLNVHVVDPKSDLVREKHTKFTVQRADASQITYADMPYYERIEYFLSSRDYKAFLDLPADGKRIYLEKFWSMRDYPAIADRFEFADANYSEGAKKGSTTERGRIYIKYGEPDEREKSFLAYQESKPYEHWQYFNGDQFVFVDIRGTNEYTLIWSNVSGESNQPTLYKYLPESLRDLIN
ncbi:GWxTD domain-containing protein [candidate division WOR-3 bacterium]|nr:GWxTD domain-containing protein [candidate division WOR-3 bacterium]